MNLITGASGFVGSWLLKTTPDATIGTRFELINKPTRVIHSAWANDPEIDLEMTKRVVDFCDKIGANLTYLSSGAVYYDDTPYANSKRECEELCKDHTILRLFSFIGPGLKKHAVYEMLTQALSHKDVIIRGTGKAVRSYLYAEDMGNLIWQHKQPGVFDIGSKEPVTIYNLASTISEMYHVGIVILNGRDGSHPYYLPKEGFTSRPLKEQISLMAEDMRNKRRVG